MYLDHYFCDFCSSLMDIIFEDDDKVIFRCPNCGMTHTVTKGFGGELF